MKTLIVRVPCWCGQLVKLEEMPVEKPLCGKPACYAKRQQARQAGKKWERAWEAAQ